MSWPSAPFQVTGSFLNESMSRVCGFVSVMRSGSPRAPCMCHTSRGCSLSSLTNATVAPPASRVGEPLTPAPRVRASTGPPSTGTRKICCAVRWAAWNRMLAPSGLHARLPGADWVLPGGTTRSSKSAVRFLTGPPPGATTHRYSFVYHSVLRASCEMNAIHLPSGDHAGCVSVPLRLTSSVGVPPLAFTR